MHRFFALAPAYTYALTDTLTKREVITNFLRKISVIRFAAGVKNKKGLSLSLHPSCNVPDCIR
jgi:hypothetical protein